MKVFRSVYKLAIVLAIGIVLITTRPSESEFAQWYVEQNQTGLGSFFDDTFETVVKQRTETKDYVVFSVFELDDEERYVGVLGHFFGRNSVEEATKTLENLVEQAKEIIDEKSGQ